MPSGKAHDPGFELARFLPYLLNQAAEQVGRHFEAVYRDKYGLTRTQWRILAHLGAYGPMTAASVSRRTQTEKSKISRAVAALTDRGLVDRAPGQLDRRVELLTPSDVGNALYKKISRDAAVFDRALRQKMGIDQANAFERMLRDLAGVYDTGEG